MGQCSDQVQSSIKHLVDFDDKDDDKDIIWILNQIKREATGFDSLGNKPINFIKAIKRLFNSRQGSEEDEDSYIKRMLLHAE